MNKDDHAADAMRYAMHSLQSAKKEEKKIGFKHLSWSLQVAIPVLIGLWSDWRVAVTVFIIVQILLISVQVYLTGKKK